MRFLAAIACLTALGCNTRNSLAPEMSGATYASKSVDQDLTRLPNPYYIVPCGGIGPFPPNALVGKPEDCAGAPLDNDCTYCAPKFQTVNAQAPFTDGVPSTTEPILIFRGDPTADD